MPFRFTPTDLAEVVIIEPKVFLDDRGFFIETYKRSEFSAHGISAAFVQANQSRSSRNTLRGLHYQRAPRAQGKLVRALSGEVFDVVVDIRKESATYGKWLGIPLSSETNRMLYVPPGLAHGFCVVTEEAEVLYMTTDEYAPDYEAGIRWDDPDLRITWPVDNPKLSARDMEWPLLKSAEG
jgi:dTDP-4-dehydrorhamnose 3,5-epimerase